MVGDRIKGLMKEKGIKQAELGLMLQEELKIKYSQPRVSKMLMDESNISIKELRAIAKILKTTVKYLTK